MVIDVYALVTMGDLIWKREGMWTMRAGDYDWMT